MPEIPYPRTSILKLSRGGCPRNPFFESLYPPQKCDAGTDVSLLKRADFPKTIFFPEFHFGLLPLPPQLTFWLTSITTQKPSWPLYSPKTGQRQLLKVIVGRI